MIFYFSGTGNSQYAASKLAREEEKVISITECVRQRNFHIEIEDDDTLGFVFPVYYGGLPSLIQEFLNHVKFQGKPAYTYSVITCGANAYGAGEMLADRLREQDIELQAVYQVVMPDNYIVMYSIQTPEEEEAILATAENRLNFIEKQIQSQEKTALSANKTAKLITSLMYPMYAKGRKTKKFWTDDRCVSCGVCEQRCPSQAIKLIDGKVTWVKDQCAHCMACARCNAIQYGNKTAERRRYTHPMLRKKH